MRTSTLSDKVHICIIITIAATCCIRAEDIPYNRRSVVCRHMAIVPVTVGEAQVDDSSAAVLNVETKTCTPDCPNDVWDGPYVVRLALPAGCDVDVTYWYRIACGSWFDTQISRIELIGPSCPDMGMNVLFGEAEIELLKLNPMKMPPIAGVDPEGTCISTFRITKASCFSPDPIWPRNIIPCRPFNCCITAYSVCLSGGVRTVVRNSWANVSNMCGAAGNCYFSCDY